MDKEKIKIEEASSSVPAPVETTDDKKEAIKKDDSRVKIGQNDDKKNKPSPAGQKFSMVSSGSGGRKRRNVRSRFAREDDGFDQKIIDIARVTRVMAGGKRMRFRACVAVGNKSGKVAIGIAKGADVTTAINKAVKQAKKDIVNVQVVNDTIAHELNHKFGAAKILLKPAKKGQGIIAGGVMRLILELAGIHNAVGKIQGTNNKVNNAKCLIEALRRLKKVEVKEVRSMPPSAEASGDKKSEVRSDKSEVKK